MYKKIISVMSVALVVFLCSSSVFASAGSTTASDTFTGYQYLDSNNEILASYTITSFKPYPIADGTGTYQFDALVKLELNNLSNKNIKIQCDGTNRIPLFIATNSMADGNQQPWRFQSISFIGGHLVPSSVDDSSSYVYLEPYNGDVFLDSNTSLIVPKNTKLVSYFNLSYWGIVANFSLMTNPTFDASTVFIKRNSSYTFSYVADIALNDYNYIPEIYDKLVEILQHYNSNVPASQNVTSDASSASSTIGNQHQQESNIYNQTNQAIGSTGIQNFQFDSQTIGGLGGVKNDFMSVWNSLGTFNSVFITSLTIGLALSIVRHRRMFKQ